MVLPCYSRHFIICSHPALPTSSFTLHIQQMFILYVHHFVLTGDGECSLRILALTLCRGYSLILDDTTTTMSYSNYYTNPILPQITDQIHLPACCLPWSTVTSPSALNSSCTYHPDYHQLSVTHHSVMCVCASVCP